MRKTGLPQTLFCTGAVATLVVLGLAGCGNSSNTTITSPTGTGSTGSTGPNYSLFTGNYVLTSTGTSPVDGDYQVAGQLVSDGKGNITSGILDYNLGGGTDQAVKVTGTYTVSGSTVTVLLTDGNAVSEAYIVTYSSSGSSSFANNDSTGKGTLYPQTTTGATVAGNYAFTLSGEGEGTVTASGKFTAPASGFFTGGTETYTDASVTQSSTTTAGVVGVPTSNGRGLAVIGGNNFSYYIISPTQLVLMGLDDRALLQGLVTKS